MNSRRLKTRPAHDHADVAQFFDANASAYSEQHGDGERLLRYRLELLRSGANLQPTDVVLEIGCGNGLHLQALAEDFHRGIGVDLSPAMIEAARERLRDSPWQNKISYEVSPAETLAPIEDASVDVVLCVGSLEHMLDQEAVLRNALRVLRPGGRLACLTLNGGSLWYRYLAPALRLDTRQLATDHYLSRRELERLARAAGFGHPQIDSWTFVQSGDMPRAFSYLFSGLDAVGKFLHIAFLRGGLRLTTSLFSEHTTLSSDRF